MNNKNVPALLGALACALAVPASAALYRCGNVFQDRPCEAASAPEAVRPARGASGPAAPVAQRAASAASAPVAPTALPAGKGEEATAVRPVAAGSTAAPAAAAPAPATAIAPARKGPPSLACPNLREQHIAIEGRLKSSSRPETVQMYQRQLREVEKNLFEGNC